ncbi:hypothetical protein BDF19DRAFT_410963 [Syncephalis fuscata]|nr:hypothetical protein BDF19DRAFT_410963 [Syncephalis fuscata]
MATCMPYLLEANVIEYDWMVMYADNIPIASLVGIVGGYRARWLECCKRCHQLEHQWDNTQHPILLKYSTSNKTTAYNEEKLINEIQRARRPMVEPTCQLQPVAVNSHFAIFAVTCPPQLYLLQHSTEDSSARQDLFDDPPKSPHELPQLQPLAWGDCHITEELSKYEIVVASLVSILHEKFFTIEFAIVDESNQSSNRPYILAAWHLLDQSEKSMKPTYLFRSTNGHIPYEMYGRWLFHAGVRSSMQNSQEIRHDSCRADEIENIPAHKNILIDVETVVMVDISTIYRTRWIASYPCGDYHIHKFSPYSSEVQRRGSQQYDGRYAWLYHQRLEPDKEEISWQLLELDNTQAYANEHDNSCYAQPCRIRVLREGKCERGLNVDTSYTPQSTSCTRLKDHYVMIFSDFVNNQLPFEDNNRYSCMLAVQDLRQDRLLWERVEPEYRLAYYSLMAEHMLLANAPEHENVIYVTNLYDGSLLHRLDISGCLQRFQTLFSSLCVISLDDDTLNICNLQSGRMWPLQEWTVDCQETYDENELDQADDLLDQYTDRSSILVATDIMACPSFATYPDYIIYSSSSGEQNIFKLQVKS